MEKIVRKIIGRKIMYPVYIFFLVFFLASCTSSNKLSADYLYFKNGSDTVAVQKKETIIQPGDQLGIQVYSKTLNQEQAAIFNIPTNSGSSTGKGSSSAAGVSSAGGESAAGGSSVGQGYQVSAIGNIEMPVIGSVKAAGLTKDQLQAYLVDKITNYVKSPTVIVRFLDFTVNVLGEVKAPGAKKFTADKVTIIDALSASSDLTDFAKRDDVKVIREVNGKKIYYSIDMRSKNIFSSPVYVLQPNDIVYVAPNNKKLKTLNTSTEVQTRIALFTTFLGIAISMTSLYFNLRR